MAALAVTAWFLPLSRDELSWWCAQSHDYSVNYLHYLSDWPEGRHVVDARLFYQHRLWEETKRAQIRQAYTMASMASPTNSDTEAAYRREQVTRRDNFLWKKATNNNTPAIYLDYLTQYPEGRHADEARQKILALGQPATGTNSTPQ